MLEFLLIKHSTCLLLSTQNSWEQKKIVPHELLLSILAGICLCDPSHVFMTVLPKNLNSYFGALAINPIHLKFGANHFFSIQELTHLSERQALVFKSSFKTPICPKFSGPSSTS